MKKIFNYTNIDYKKTISFILLFVVLSFISSTFWLENKLSFSFNCISKQDVIFQIFYSSTKDFSKENSINIKKTKKENSVSFSIPLRKVTRIKINISELSDIIQLSNFVLHGNKTKNLNVNDFSYNNENAHLKKELLILEPFDDEFFMSYQKELNIRRKLQPHFTKALLIIFFEIFVCLTIINFLYSKKYKHKNNLVFCILFFLFIFIPMTQISDSTISRVENRTLTQKPSISTFFSKNGFKYGEQFETWFSDHFWKRKKIIRTYQNLNYFINAGIENDHALQGLDGWLFSKQHNAVNMYKNENLFTEEELIQIGKKVNKFVDSAKSFGIQHIYFYLSNDKESLYPEYYKKDILPTNPVSRLNQTLSYIHKNYPQIKFFNFRKELEDIKKTGEILFCKTGTHTNDMGAFYEYNFLINKIKLDNPNIIPLTLNDFTITEEKKCDMDIYSELNLSNKNYSDNNLINKVLSKKKETIKEKNVINLNKSLVYTSVKNSSSNNKKHILVLHDSFFERYEQYFYENFYWTENFYWGFGLDFNLSREEKQKTLNHHQIPDIILVETTERFLQRFLTLTFPLEN